MAPFVGREGIRSVITGISPFGLKKSKGSLNFLHVLGSFSGISCCEPRADGHEGDSGKSGDDGNDDEEFDESESSFAIGRGVCFHLLAKLGWLGVGIK